MLSLHKIVLSGIMIQKTGYVIRTYLHLKLNNEVSSSCMLVEESKMPNYLLVEAFALEIKV